MFNWRTTIERARFARRHFVVIRPQLNLALRRTTTLPSYARILSSANLDETAIMCFDTSGIYSNTSIGHFEASNGRIEASE